MREVVIIDGLRTPFGKFGGSLRNIPLATLGATVIKGLLERNKLAPQLVDEVILGNVLPTGDPGGNPARIAAIMAGLPDHVPAWTVNINCASGLQAVNIAAQYIALGSCDVIIAGGMESMSNTTFQSTDARWGAKLKHSTLHDSLLLGLYDPISRLRMDQTAEKLASQYGVTRQEQDEFAVQSHNRTEQAIKEGRFKEEILPILVDARKNIVFDTDEHLRYGATYPDMAKLPPAFAKDGTVTAGNASGINDGAAVLLIMSSEKAAELNLEPLGKIISYAAAGVDPSVMGIGPVAATRKALAKIGMDPGKLELIECNEAFAAQYLAVEKEMGWDRKLVNVNGGAIALGHPVSASGPRLLMTLLYEMRRRELKTGLATLCVGGGHGVATMVSRV